MIQTLFYITTDTRLPFITITVQDITDMINSLQTNKAVGPDLISHKLLKRTINSISKPLCLLFNKSLFLEIFPSSWKSAKVMPLFKKGDTSFSCNYRPISLLSCIGKLMERCVHKYLHNYLHANNLIYEKQSGFLPGHSTFLSTY